ncbi:MAG: hypothetical protein LBR37_03810 [Erysipelotrichaceae bacterium]|jgi:hypothetical protein|nr:hypothetical protein [Erysipelotrichaceae bacterium]
MGSKDKKLKGKIAWVDGKKLGLKSGHYVYIRSINGNTCDVNTFTSLEYDKQKYMLGKINYVRDGSVYSIPKEDLTLPKFSGVRKGVITVNLKDLQSIGRHKIKRRHHFYVIKFLK